MFTIASRTIIKVPSMTTSSTFQTIVFDLDGTLLDTWPSLLDAAMAVSPLHAGLLDPRALRLMLSEGIAPMFALAARQMNLAPDAATGAMANHYADCTLLAARPYPYAGESLQELAQAGYTLAICTNRDRASTLELLVHFGWQHLFSHIQCIDDGAPAKPDPRPLLDTLARLDTHPQQALFIGDSHVDARCAAGANVRFAAHLGGYHAHRDDLLPAVFSFEHPGALPRWLACQSLSTPLLEPQNG